MKKDKRYLVFAISDYYPTGGLSDVLDSFDYIKDAISLAKSSSDDYVYVYDRELGMCVYDKIDLPEY